MSPWFSHFSPWYIYISPVFSFRGPSLYMFFFYTDPFDRPIQWPDPATNKSRAMWTTTHEYIIYIHISACLYLNVWNHKKYISNFEFWAKCGIFIIFKFITVYLCILMCIFIITIHYLYDDFSLSSSSSSSSYYCYYYHHCIIYTVYYIYIYLYLYTHTYIYLYMCTDDV